mmetsp:Transcript_30057/g.70136  ORF Transcript_30057/g.70136 Transcript_30057/m.70136 type:complete len:234 (-) Transcript_30057:688-1389(-)
MSSPATEDSNWKKRKADEMADKQLVLMSKEELIRLIKDLQAKNSELKTENVALKSNATSGTVSPSEESDDEDDVSVVDVNDKWEVLFRQLREHRILHGRCTIEKGDNCDQKFSKWVKYQRFLYANVKFGRNGQPKISPERIMKLDSIDMFWGSKFPAPASWDDRFEALKKYKTAMGKEPHVQKGLENPQPLAKWVSTQRTEYRRFKKQRDSLLTLEHIQRLNEIGFNWKGPRF